jgi:hypothetical protein
LRNAFYDQAIPKFLIRDRDNIFGEDFIESVSALGLNPILAAYRSPWQNGYCERLIGSIRRECLDHLIIVNDNHLRKCLKRYLHYYHNQRTHLGLNKDSPEPRGVQAEGDIDKVAVVNGLHHYYFRHAAEQRSRHLLCEDPTRGPKEIDILAGRSAALRMESMRTSLSLNRELSPTCLFIAQDIALNS